MRTLLKSRWFRIAALVLLLAGMYAGAGFWLVPRLLRSAIVDQAKAALGLEATVGEIRFNPFLLELDLRDVAITDASRQPMAGFSRLFVDFEISSLWHRAYVFQEADIERPFVRAIQGTDGRLNLMRLEPKSITPAPAARNAPLPRIEIALLRISGGSASYEDRSRPAHFTMQLAPVDFTLRNFVTDAQGGQFHFSASSKLDERIDWRGSMSVRPPASDGEIRITDLSAHTVWAYLKNELGNRIGFIVHSGKIAADAHYRFSLRDVLQLNADGVHVEVSDLRVAPPGSATDWVTLPSLKIDGTSVDVAGRQVHVDRVVLTGLGVSAWLNADRSINLTELRGAAPPPVATTPRTAAPPAWRVDVKKFTLEDAHIAAEDRATAPPAKVVLAPISLEVDGASLDLSRPLAVKLASGVDGKGRFAATGEIVPSPLAARVAAKANDIDLRALQPYIAQLTSMTLKRGFLSGDLDLRYQHGGPAMTLAGNVRVDDLHTVDNALRNDFINWRRLDVRGLKFQVDPDRLTIARIVARAPYARVIIEPDQTLNVKRILTRAGPGPGSAKTAAKVRARAAAAPPPQHAERAMPIAIKAVDVYAGRADFTDLSIQPNFSSGIDKLNGRILGLSSAPNARAHVDLGGEVGPYAPVSIKGDVNPFGPALYADLAMSFRNMDLTIFNPYAGKFAGYNITKGKLTTELHYKIVGRKLDATHHVVVDQLEFGGKTASKDAVSLPIKLAVALLRDRHGVIDLNLPVKGSLGDPKFRLGPIIWQVLLNILTKAVTAPFALLGHLFGAGPQIQYVDFHAGSAALDATGIDKMRAVAKALGARPQLKVDVPIAPLAALDAPALAARQFAAEIAAARVAQAGANKPKRTAAAPPPFDQLDARAQIRVLTALYREQFGAAPRFPPPAEAPKSASEAQLAQRTYLETQLKSRITVGDEELKVLAEQRAVALEKALLTDTGLDPQRVFLVANDKAAVHGGMARLELSLE